MPTYIFRTYLLYRSRCLRKAEQVFECRTQVFMPRHCSPYTPSTPSYVLHKSNVHRYMYGSCLGPFIYVHLLHVQYLNFLSSLRIRQFCRCGSGSGFPFLPWKNPTISLAVYPVERRISNLKQYPEIAGISILRMKW